MINWPDMLNGKCPVDGGKLSCDILLGRYFCDEPLCDFDISEEKFDQIISSLATKADSMKPPQPMFGRGTAPFSS